MAKRPEVKLPRVTPRKEEWQAVLAIMEDESYETGEAMAKAIVAETYRLLLQRDWYVLVWEPEPDYAPKAYLAWGFYATEAAAQKALEQPERYGIGGGRAMVLPVRSLSDRLVWIEEQLDLVRTSNVCVTCGHQKAAHDFPRLGGRCIGRCGCMDYTPA